MKTNPNDAAFARPHSEDEFNEEICHSQKGLTKREYFAALAMQGMLAYGNEKESYDPMRVPDKAVEIADALIQELNK